MNALVMKAFKDKDTKSVFNPGQIIEVTEERFSELNAGPFGIFVNEIKEDPPVNQSKQSDNDNTISDKIPQGEVDQPGAEPPEEDNDKDVNFDKLNKTKIVEYAKEIGIELNMELTKKEMIEILLKK